MKPANLRILAINGGASSMKPALFEAGIDDREQGLSRFGS
jgi:acetate kinase